MGMQTATLGKRPMPGRPGGKPVVPNFDAKTGLLAHDNKRVVEGTATWIIAGPRQAARAAGPAGNRLPPGASYANPAMATFLGGASQSDTAASSSKGKGKTEKKRREEDASLVRRLKRDGGKTVGGKYLLAAKPDARTAEAADDVEGDEDEEAERPAKGKTNAFTSAQLRKLGFDPTRKDEARPADAVADVQRQQVRLRASRRARDPTYPGSSRHRRASSGPSVGARQRRRAATTTTTATCSSWSALLVH
jgi:hypothetical protein